MVNPNSLISFINGEELMKFSCCYRVVELSAKGPILTTQRFQDTKSNDTIIVKPIMVGVCRSDIKEAQGNRTVRQDFGHEIVAKVEWTDAPVSLSIGDLVCFDPHVELSRTSGFADLIVAKGSPSAIHRAFLKVTHEISFEKLVFCEPMACAQHCVSNLLRYLQMLHLHGLRVGIIGAGNSGTLIGLLIKNLGGEVKLFNRSIERLEFLQERQIFSLNELSLLTESAIGNFDVVIPTTSFLYSSVLNLAVQAVKPNGLILLFGGTKKGDCLLDTNVDIDFIRRKEQLVNITWQDKSFQIGGTHGALSDDFLKVIELFKNAPSSFPIERLITKIIPLDDLPRALQDLAKSASQGKIIVEFSS